MKVLGVVLVLYISAGISTATVCEDTLVDVGGRCAYTCESHEIEDPSYGFMACLGSVTGSKCCKRYVPPTTPEPTTPEPTTTTEPPTTEPTTTTVAPAPPKDQCGVQKKMDAAFLTARILDGTTSQTCDWPWMVSIRGRRSPTAQLLPNDDTFPLCSGVIIDAEYVLTTADCVMMSHLAGGGSDPTQNILLIAGETNVNEIDFGSDFIPTERVYKLSEVKIHPGFFKTDISTWTFADLIPGTKDILEPNNFALLKLERPITFTDCIRQVCLPMESEVNETMHCKIAAWGNDKEVAGQELPGPLAEADVTVVKQSCLKAAADFFSENITPLAPLTTLAKFNSNTQGTCLSDGGGMVVCPNDENRWVLNGLINRPDLSDCKSSSVFVISDVRQALGWINGEVYPVSTPTQK